MEISVCTIDESRAVCDLCLVAFTRSEINFAFQINVSGTEKSHINVCVQGAYRHLQFRMVGYDLIRGLPLLDQRGNDLVLLAQFMSGHIYAAAGIVESLLILPVCKTRVIFIFVRDRAAADLFLTAIADIRRLVKTAAAFFLKIAACLVAGGTGSAFDSAQDDLSACIRLFAVVTMDTEVLCIIKRTFMIPVG